MDDPDQHPLAAVLAAAVRGVFPPPDGAVEVLPPDSRGTRAVVELTGHAYILTDLPSGLLASLGADGFGGASHPRVLTAVAGVGDEIGTLDAVLARWAIPGPARLGELDSVEYHPRVRRARSHRRGVRVLGDERGLVCVGRGLVGRLEMSVELTGATPGGGAGRELVTAALAGLPADEPVFAQVSPGNAASLRLFLGCGFVPIGSEVLISHAHGDAVR